MTEKKVTGKKEANDKKPQYSADGVAVWCNRDKNNKSYLAIKIVGHKTIYAFENKEK